MSSLSTIVTEMESPIAVDEVTRAIISLNAGKAVGPKGVPPDMFTHGDRSLVRFLTSFS